MSVVLSESMKSASRRGVKKYLAKRAEKMKRGKLVKTPRKPLKRPVALKWGDRAPQVRKISRKPIKRVRKVTGELALFRKLYEERGRKCEITGQPLPFFNVCNFMHVLSKGSHPKFRLNPDNIILTIYGIHWLYDNASKEQLLKSYPKAIQIYEKKEQLKQQYHGTK